MSLGVRSGECRMGWGGQAGFGQKLLNTQVWCGQVGSKITHHEMGKSVESLKKNSLKPNAASHNYSS